MKLLKGLGTVLCLTVLCIIVAPKAKADEWNQKTVVTFSAPVEVPGVGQHILPAGTYVFKLMDSLSDRNISSRSSTCAKTMCTPPFSPSPIIG